MYLKNLIEKYGKEAKYHHEGMYADFGFVDDKDTNNCKVATWFYPDRTPIKDCDSYNGYKRVVFNEIFLDDKWKLVEPKV